MHDILASHDHFSENDAKHVARQIFKGLNYLQMIGVVHRDIKVENVLLLESSPTSAVSPLGLDSMYTLFTSLYLPSVTQRWTDFLTRTPLRSKSPTLGLLPM